MSEITIITDGSADNRNGSGGWCAIVRTPSTLVELTGWATETTSNRMELTAAIEGLRSVQVPSDITVVADSSYLLNTMRRKWYENWILNDWKRDEPRPNMDLWQILIGLSNFHNIKWVKIKGHSGDYWNERADRLADFARRNKEASRNVNSTFQEGIRCVLLAESGQQCKLHSSHSGACYFTNSKANGVEVYGA